MKLTLDMTKSLEENAADYFQKAKKARGKLDGITRTIDRYTKELEAWRAKQEQEEETAEVVKHTVSEKAGRWFDKFRWFFSSEGFLVVAGSNATSNDILVKKHAQKDDVVLHTDMAGSPFVVVKTDKDEANELLGELAKPDVPLSDATLEEAAIFCLAHGRPWKLGLASESVFVAKPSQVKTNDPSGITLPKGSFYIDGQTRRLTPTITFAVGVVGDYVIGASKQSVEAYDKQCVVVTQGNMKTGMGAKVVKGELSRFHDDVIDVNSVMNVLPAGGIDVQKKRKTKDEL